MSEQKPRQYRGKRAWIRMPNAKVLGIDVADIQLQDRVAVITDVDGNAYIVNYNNVLIKGEWVE